MSPYRTMTPPVSMARRPRWRRFIARALVWRRALVISLIRDKMELARIRAQEKAWRNLSRHFK